MPRLRVFLCSVALLPPLTASAAGLIDATAAAKATNELGLDLYRSVDSGDENLCLSPYSIESALAMTFAGAEGETRREMMRVLHVPQTGDEIHGSFATLQKQLEGMVAKSAEDVTQRQKSGGLSEPITLAIANRLFAEKTFSFREEFLGLVRRSYGAPLEPLGFARDPAGATRRINDWVAEQTRKRIRGLIPPGALDETTRMVLTNAVYLKAAWSNPFAKEQTASEPFHVRGDRHATNVPMMHRHFSALGYAKHSGFAAIALPYIGGELNFIILLPDEVNGLADLEGKLTAEILTERTKLQPNDVELWLPKFKFEPPTIPLKSQLQGLGMKSAFDIPRGSANFDRLAPRRPDEYLYLSNVFHKTFIAVDEKGTEAAAATAVAVMATSAMLPRTKPIEVKVDRPFIYAIQHVPSGACLFIGRVTEPR